ncbi:MAG: universal stress protein [Fuerstiella sp.]
MILLNQIMVATDFSERSLLAIAYAVELARPFHAEVVGCHVMEPAHALLPAMAGGPESSVDVRASQAREETESLLRKAGANRYRVLIEKGNPTREIIRVARNERIDLIVVSTHGRSGLAHMLLGSNAENIVRLAPCPVLVVRDGEHDFVHPS